MGVQSRKLRLPQTIARTSMITDQPKSTLSYFVPVTSTNTKNGSVLFTPAVVTFLSTSRCNTDFVTYTHIVANPLSSIPATRLLESQAALRGTLGSDPSQIFRKPWCNGRGFRSCWCCCRYRSTLHCFLLPTTSTSQSPQLMASRHAPARLH